MCVSTVRAARNQSQIPHMHKQAFNSVLHFIISLKHHRPACLINTSVPWRHITGFAGKLQILPVICNVQCYASDARAQNEHLNLPAQHLTLTFVTALCHKVVLDLHFHFHFSKEQQIDLILRRDCDKTLESLVSAFFYRVPSLFYYWDTPRLRPSAWSVCIPVELYLKARSLHRLEECTSVARPRPTDSLSHCLHLSFCLSACCIGVTVHVSIHNVFAFVPVRKSGMKTSVVYHINKCFRMSHDLKSSFMRCQVCFCAWVWELNKYKSECINLPVLLVVFLFGFSAFWSPLQFLWKHTDIVFWINTTQAAYCLCSHKWYMFLMKM